MRPWLHVKRPIGFVFAELWDKLLVKQPVEFVLGAKDLQALRHAADP